MKVVVIGAGATGLALGYLLARQGADVTIVDAARRPGGLLATFDIGDGHQLEHFYHHFFTHDAELHWLLGELGLADRVIYRPTTMGIYRGGCVYNFDSPTDLLQFGAISVAARIRFGASAAMLAYLPSFVKREDVSAYAWLRRWAGPAATDAIWGPMLSIKFGDAAEQVPLAWIAGRMRQRVRSRSGAEERLGYLRGSLQVLVDRLVEEFGRLGGRLTLNARLEHLVQLEGRVTGVATSVGVIQADAVVATIPTAVLAPFVREIDPAYADALDGIEYFGAVCTILTLREPLSPIYWLNVADPDFDFGGVIEHTNFVPPEEYGGRHIAYLSRYMRMDSELWRMDDAALLERQLTQLTRMFPDVRDKLVESKVFRGRFAATVCDLGFASRIPAFRSPIPNLFVGSMCHVYPDERSVNNSIRVAAAVGDAMGFDTSEVPRNMSLAATYGSEA